MLAQDRPHQRRTNYLRNLRKAAIICGVGLFGLWCTSLVWDIYYATGDRLLLIGMQKGALGVSYYGGKPSTDVDKAVRESLLAELRAVQWLRTGWNLLPNELWRPSMRSEILLKPEWKPGNVVTYLIIPFWIPISVVTSVAFGCWVWERLNPPPSPYSCSQCRYSLIGNVSSICPECGTPIPPELMERIRTAKQEIGGCP